jgi:hypothetical protein
MRARISEVCCSEQTPQRAPALVSDFGKSAQGPLDEDSVNPLVTAAGEILVVDFTASAGMQASL